MRADKNNLFLENCPLNSEWSECTPVCNKHCGNFDVVGFDFLGFLRIDSCVINFSHETVLPMAVVELCKDVLTAINEMKMKILEIFCRLAASPCVVDQQAAVVVRDTSGCILRTPKSNFLIYLLIVY